MNEHAWLVQRFEAVRTPPPSPDPSRLVCGPRGHEEGDRRGSNPRPPLEPQSADTCFRALPDVAESAYLSQLPLLEVVRCFWVLRPEWCQKWCHTVSAAAPIPRHLILPKS